MWREGERFEPIRSPDSKFEMSLNTLGSEILGEEEIKVWSKIDLIRKSNKHKKKYICR